MPPSIWDEAVKQQGLDRRAFLHAILKGHPRFHWLWERVRTKPEPFEKLASDWSNDSSGDYSVNLERLVSACNAARRFPGDQPLLPCRYHLFASGLEGLFLELASDEECLMPSSDWDVPKLGIRTLDVRRLKPEGRVAFEVSRCMNCQYPFISVDAVASDHQFGSTSNMDSAVVFLAFTDYCSEGERLGAIRIDLRDGRIEMDKAPGTPIWRTYTKSWFGVGYRCSKMSAMRL